MPTHRWKIYDTATGEIDLWDPVRPLGQSATLEEVAANISDSVLAADGYHPTHANCFEAWGFKPVSWDGQSRVLTAKTSGNGFWGAGHVLTAAWVEFCPVENPAENF